MPGLGFGLGLGMGVVRAGGSAPQPDLLAVDHYRADTAAAPLAIETYDGADELLHPSVWDSHRDLGEDWNGYRYWLVATPYADSNNEIENPCIYASADLKTWVVPDGLTNPIEPKPSGAAYNSDTHLTWGRDGYLYCIWRASESAEPAEKIYYKRSSDGVTWGDKTLMVSNQSTTSLVSPSVEWDGTQWVMYCVVTTDSPNTLVRLTASSLAGEWSSPTACTLSLPAGRDMWHLDAKRVRGKWLILMQDTDLNDAWGGNLWLCESDDGLTFTRPDLPVIPSGSNWHVLFYRSCLVPKVVGDTYAFDLIYTGITEGNSFFLGHTEILPFDKEAYDAEPAVAIAGAVNEEAPYLVGDDFNRADGAIGNATSGQAWTMTAGGPTGFQVASNQLKVNVVDNTRGHIDAGIADVYVEAWVKPDTNAENWLVVRYADSSNYYRIGINGTSLTVQKIAAGSLINVIYAANAAPGLRGTPAAARIGVRCSGNDFEVLMDGRVALRFSDAFNNTATGFGLQSYSTLVRYDDFFVRALVDGK